MNVISLLTAKCPNCHKGRMFKSRNVFRLKMNNNCTECGYDFEREPGFYTGAMYVSYGLSLVEVLVVYILCRMAGATAFDQAILLAMVVALLLLITFNFRISRAAWLALFSFK